jgi:radical SAM protein with 4Fe4S-binding SPASM domain
VTAVALTQLRYAHRLYGGLRAANQDYSPDDDMARYPFPRAIQLQTINACQASCVMCPYPVYKDVFQRGRMDEALFDKITEEIAGRSDVDTFIPMLQNEPFLDKRLFEKVRRFKERTGGRVKVELVTNGAFLTDEVIEQIRESALDVLDISLDALSREVYAKIRIGLDYDAVQEGVERVLRADLRGTKVFVRLIRLRENRDEVRAFARYWRRRGIPVFIYTANNRTGALDEIGSRGALVPDEQTPWHHRLGRRAFRAYMQHCPLPFAATNILHNGDMLMCVHDWGRKEVIGNVRDATIADLWNGPRMREIRRLVSQRRYDELPACKSCSLCHDGWF